MREAFTAAMTVQPCDSSQHAGTTGLTWHHWAYVRRRVAQLRRSLDEQKRRRSSAGMAGGRNQESMS